MIYLVNVQIGSHTFHLHEIYGLSSTSTTVHPTAPEAPPVGHTYPPTVPVPTEDEPSSECLVCLSSPREVVLLPCRHLVACKECAINMIEFGAGGAITHAEEPTTTAEAQPAETTETTVDDSARPGSTGEEAADPSAVDASQVPTEPVGDSPPAEASSPPTAAPTTPNVLPIAPVPPNPRRKRRAKGWFCPVCRQRKSSLPFHSFIFRNFPSLSPRHFFFFDPFRLPSPFPDLNPPHPFLSQHILPCCGSRPLLRQWRTPRKVNESRRRL